MHGLMVSIVLAWLALVLFVLAMLGARGGAR